MCFLNESRYVSLHERGDKQNEILKKIKDLGEFVAVIREYLPEADIKKPKKGFFGYPHENKRGQQNSLVLYLQCVGGL